MIRDKLLTEFNSNVATLERVDRFLRHCANASIAMDVVSWYQYLDILKREACVKMKEEEEYNETLERFRKLRKNVRRYQLGKGNQSEIKNKLIRDLDEAEIHLRQFMNDHGMLLTDKDFSIEGI